MEMARSQIRETERCPRCKSKLSPEIGGAIRHLRKRRGWTIDQLKGKSGLSKGFLSDIENGKRNISLTSLEALAKAFKMKTWMLVRFHEEGDKSI
jgi:transcriptional regulator with XRE-family HTH domain